MLVLIFSTKFVWNISHSKKKWEKCDQKYITVLHVKYPLFLSDLITLEFSRKILEKFSNIKSHENSPPLPQGGAELLHDEVNSRFRVFAKAPKN